jgi:hypothetical protein
MMIDLRVKLATTADHLSRCLTTSRDNGLSLGLLFYHTHRNYGQSHVCVVENDTVEPEDEVLGLPIDYVIDYEGWNASTGWHQSGPGNDDIELTLLNGRNIAVPTNHMFKEIWAEQVADLIRTAFEHMDSTLLPRRVVVAGQNGESYSDWLTED